MSFSLKGRMTTSCVKIYEIWLPDDVSSVADKVPDMLLNKLDRYHSGHCNEEIEERD